MMVMPKLDALDEKILAILKQNARTSLSEIAKKINRSRTAVQARVQKLETSGVINGYTTITSDKKNDRVGALITVFLHERLRPESVVAMLQAFKEVRHCYRVSGDADLIVELSEGPSERIQQVCNQLWNHENVRLTDTVFIMGTLLEN